MATDPQTARERTLRPFQDKVRRWTKRLNDTEDEILEKFHNRSVATVGCTNCDSRFGFPAFSLRAEQFLMPLVFPDDTPTEVRAVTCPLCGVHLIANADVIRLHKLQLRVDKAKAALAEVKL
jgi:hypothetical protein